MTDDRPIEGEPTGGKEAERTNEQLTAKMETMVEMTKDLGIPYAIEELQLKLDNGFGDFARTNARGRLERAEQMPDDDPRKSPELEVAREVVEHANRFEEATEGTLQFLTSIAMGNLPKDWLVVPEWSVNYGYDGIYSHNVKRNNVTAELALKRAGIEPSEASEEQKREIFRQSIIKNNIFLSQKSAKEKLKFRT